MMNGDIINDKFVQVYVDSGVVPICWEQSTRDDVANTVCKQLGLDGARTTNAVRYAPHAVINCSCKGTNIYA